MSAEVKERKIIENDLSFAFPTHQPVIVGHTIVMPKRHVTRYEDLTQEEKESIEELRIKIMAALKRAFGAEGFNFAWNDGEMAGQSVSHFHLHIVPRKEGDTGVYNYNPQYFLYLRGEKDLTPEEELKSIAKLILDNIS